MFIVLLSRDQEYRPWWPWINNLHMVYAVKLWTTAFYRTHDAGEDGDDDDAREYDDDNDERKCNVPAHVWPCLRMGIWSKSNSCSHLPSAFNLQFGHATRLIPAGLLPMPRRPPTWIRIRNRVPLTRQSDRKALQPRRGDNLEELNHALSLASCNVENIAHNLKTLSMFVSFGFIKCQICIDL